MPPTLLSWSRRGREAEINLSNILSNIFSIDIDHVPIAIDIVIVLLPSPIPPQRSCVFIQSFYLP